MALSNIFNEPRREIIETAVGLGAVVVPIALFLWLDYSVASALYEGAVSRGKDPAPVPVIMLANGVIGVILLVVGALVAVGIHAAGEGVCNALERRGVYLRPRNRGR